MTLRDRPDPADVEIWEQLQRALTKLDQAEQREKKLRRERDRALFDLKTEGERHEETQERAEQAEAQLGQAKEALRELERPILMSSSGADVELALPLSGGLSWLRQKIIARRQIARSALDALDQTNREVRS